VETWANVICTSPSNHVFEASDTITLDNPYHLYDPDAGNNSGQADAATVEVTGTGDVAVSDVTVTSPASAADSPNTFNVDVSADIDFTGFITSANVTWSLTVPGDCAQAPPGDQAQRVTGNQADMTTPGLSTATTPAPTTSSVP
jgi:hypothetical protein